jgi:hypothetical protein
MTCGIVGLREKEGVLQQTPLEYCAYTIASFA